ncbi:MAG: MBL fold metallo-hydrolase [Methylococcaceae bacterium]|nr:MBL fold metallo-hydrolase [Methylococcaceae bacterium]
MIFRQLFDSESWTYTYLLGDESGQEAVFIDPVNTHIDEYLKLLDDYGLKLKYSLETHVHADHITASGLLRQRTGAATGVSQLCGASYATRKLNHGDVLRFGEKETILVIATPGHTAGSLSFHWRDRVFTGDALFINGCGRTDFQGGDAGALYDGITRRLFTLPAETLVHPGHDYNGRWVSSIVQERTTNARLAGKTREQFIEIMQNLDLPKPKFIDVAVPSNRLCGLSEEEARQDCTPTPGASEPAPRPASANMTTPQDLVREAKQQIREIDAPAARQLLANSLIVVVDVREPEEFSAGGLPGAISVPRGVLEFRLGNIPELTNPNASLLLYCRTGGRSALAAQTLQRLGYTNVLSLSGGYEAWRKASYAEKPRAAASTR